MRNTIGTKAISAGILSIVAGAVFLAAGGLNSGLNELRSLAKGTPEALVEKVHSLGPVTLSGTTYRTSGRLFQIGMPLALGGLGLIGLGLVAQRAAGRKPGGVPGPS
jgi:hypothetical protein